LTDTKQTSLLVTTVEEFRKSSLKIVAAQNNRVPIVTTDFFLNFSGSTLTQDDFNTEACLFHPHLEVLYPSWIFVTLMSRLLLLLANLKQNQK
jgi:hypothetical protein